MCNSSIMFRDDIFHLINWFQPLKIVFQKLLDTVRTGQKWPFWKGDVDSFSYFSLISVILFSPPIDTILIMPCFQCIRWPDKRGILYQFLWLFKLDSYIKVLLVYNLVFYNYLYATPGKRGGLWWRTTLSEGEYFIQVLNFFSKFWERNSPCILYLCNVQNQIPGYKSSPLIKPLPLKVTLLTRPDVRCIGIVKYY
jgi:hypothetical protein